MIKNEWKVEKKRQDNQQMYKKTNRYMSVHASGLAGLLIVRGEWPEWPQLIAINNYCICTVHVIRSHNCQYQHMHNFNVTG